MKTSEYIAAVKAKLNVSSDYAVAKALGTSRQRVSGFVNGKTVPGPLTAFKIAEILGDQPAAVIADFEAERAEKMGKDEDLDAWRAVLQQLRKVAGLAGMSILLAAGSAGFSNADARLATQPTIDTERTSYLLSWPRLSLDMAAALVPP